MKIFCNQPESLPKEISELLQINGYLIEAFDPLVFNIEEYTKAHISDSNEIHIFLCYINYIQFSDLTQFPFLLKNHELNVQLKFIAVFNDSNDSLDDKRNYKNITETHYLSDPHFSLIQKIKIQILNWENNKIWGSKVLILDNDISNQKLLNQILSNYSILTICCSNVYEAKKYLNKQIKLIVLSEYFALNKSFSELLYEIEYKRSRICIVNHGSEELIREIKSNGYNLIFERPLKLENFIHVLLGNIRATTTSIIKKKAQETETLDWPIKEFLLESSNNLNTLKSYINYFYQTHNKASNNDRTPFLKKDIPINIDIIQKIRSDYSKNLIEITNEELEITTHIKISKDADFFLFAQSKLAWLLDDLFVNITQMTCFPKVYPDQWFIFLQKDLRKAILSPTVLLQFLTYEIYNKREYIYQCLNASIICSQLILRAIPNEYGEWPDKMEDEWDLKQKEHFSLIKLALSIRYDLFRKLTNSYSQNLQNQLDLSKSEADILLNFHWISPYEETIEFAFIARTLKMAHRFICLSTGVHSKSYSEEPLSVQETCFKMLFEENPLQFRPEEMMDFLYLMKMWHLWSYHENIRLIKKFPCILAKDIHVAYKPIKIECSNHLRASEFQHLEFCKGCHSSSINTDLDRKVHYCRSGNERLAPLTKKIFGPDADIEGLYDSEINKSKKSHLL